MTNIELYELWHTGVLSAGLHSYSTSRDIHYAKPCM